MKLARDIMSLSTFERDSNKVMRQMKKTKEPVVLTVNGKAAIVDAETDINSSFEWGCRAWGGEGAEAWIVQLHRTTRDPAPEGEELDFTVRHSIVGRYRILFIVEKRTVTVLHVRIPYAGQVPAIPTKVGPTKKHKKHK